MCKTLVLVTLMQGPERYTGVELMHLSDPGKCQNEGLTRLCLRSVFPKLRGFVPQTAKDSDLIEKRSNS